MHQNQILLSTSKISKRAIEVGKLLEQNGVSHFEEPCRYWKLEETKQVTEALSIDVTGGEQDWDFIVWQKILDLNVVDILQPDVMYMGGITRTLEVAKMAANRNKIVTPHSANLSLVTICTMHLLKAIPNAGKYLEYSIESVLLQIGCGITSLGALVPEELSLINSK